MRVDHKLQQSNAIPEFSQENIRANRSGHITQQQREKLKQARLWTLIVASVILYAGSGLIIYSVKEIPNYKTYINSLLFNIMALVAGIILFSYSIILFVIWHRIRLDLNIAEVRSVVGEIQFLFKTGRGGISYYLKIKSLKFNISRQLYQELVDRKKYRVYYAPYSKTLLSIEQLNPKLESVSQTMT